MKRTGKYLLTGILTYAFIALVGLKVKAEDNTIPSVAYKISIIYKCNPYWMVNYLSGGCVNPPINYPIQKVGTLCYDNIQNNEQYAKCVMLDTIAVRLGGGNVLTTPSGCTNPIMPYPCNNGVLQIQNNEQYVQWVILDTISNRILRLTESSGTVKSVGLATTLPFTISGNPITTTGTFTVAPTNATGFLFNSSGIATWSSLNNFAWLTTGNTGTNPSVNHIGTNDAEPLIFLAGGSISGRIDFTTPDNTSLGNQTLNSLTTGQNNAAFGLFALRDLTSGQGNVAMGMNALMTDTSGSNNTAIGRFAADNITTGSMNTAIGAVAMEFNSSGVNNVAVGYRALLNGNGNNNTGVGDSTLVKNTGSNNTAIGNRAGADATTKSGQFYLGDSILNKNYDFSGSFSLYYGGAYNSGITGQVLISQGANVSAQWATISTVTSSNDLTGQTTAVSSVTSFTTGASTGTYRVGGYLNITAISLGDIIQLQVTFTDENSASQTEIFPSNNLVVSYSAIGNNPMLPMDIRVKNATTITIKTVLTTSTGTITYDVGGSITKLY